MKSMGGGGVAILHPQDSYNNHVVDNMFNTPNKSSHRNVKFNHHQNQNPDNRTRTQPKGKNNRNTKTVAANNSNEFFAGFAFVESPPPSSVPLPAFFTKNMSGTDDPTTELRRILGLTLSN